MKCCNSIFVLLFVIVACDTPLSEGPDCHPSIYFHNATDDTLYVSYSTYNTASFDAFSNPCNVHPHSTNKDALSLFWNSWESVFEEDDDMDSLTVWISEYNLLQASGDGHIGMNNGIQCYYLSLEELQMLNFQINYPPIHTMRSIRMLPCYKDAIAGKTLQDIDLEQEEQDASWRGLNYFYHNVSGFDKWDFENNPIGEFNMDRDYDYEQVLLKSGSAKINWFKN